MNYIYSFQLLYLVFNIRSRCSSTSVSAIGCIPHPHRIIILRCKLGALNASRERLSVEKKRLYLYLVSRMCVVGVGVEGEAWPAPPPPRCDVIALDQCEVSPSSSSARPGARPLLSTTTHSPAPAVLHPCFLLHFRMTDRLKNAALVKLKNSCLDRKMKAEWKLRDEQLHDCQHGVNEKWRHVERKETLLELGHTINCCRVIFESSFTNLLRYRTVIIL